MSKKEKVTIKFWDKKKREYDEFNNYMVCEIGRAWHLYGGMDSQLDEVDHIKPHFYISDKRIG